MTMASARAIRAGLDQAGWGTTDLWRAAIGMGGGFTPADVEGFVTGEQDATRIEHDVLASTLNDHFVGLGQNHPVPLWNQLEPL